MLSVSMGISGVILPVEMRMGESAAAAVASAHKDPTAPPSLAGFGPDLPNRLPFGDADFLGGRFDGYKGYSTEGPARSGEFSEILLEGATGG
jgi:hypothetical protein